VGEPDLSAIRLVDHHCHGVVRRLEDRAAFESLINEGFDPPPPGTSHFDSPIGLAIRRWCGPVLDVEPLASPDDYLTRRAELGEAEVDRRFLTASGLGALFVDSGYRSEEILGVAEMGELAGAPASEVVRLEAVAERIAADGVDPAGYPEAFERALSSTADTAVGLKTIVAYRGGFAFDPSPPAREGVVRAAGRWMDGAEPSRLTDPVLLRFGIWTGADLARQRGLPLQVHSGWGDSDLRIHLANPALLTDLVRAMARLPVDVVFLHCWPYHRESAYLAAVFPNVYFDVGSALNYTGPTARGFLREALELAPFTKQLYSSDAFGLPELYYLGATLFRRALSGVLGAWVGDGECSTEDADRIAGMIGRDNALRIYRRAPAGAA